MFKKSLKPADVPATILADMKTVQDSSQKEKKIQQARDALLANFQLLKEMLFHINDKSEETGRIATKEMLAGNFISQVMESFDTLTFENQKQFKDIVSVVLKDSAGKEHMASHMNLVYGMIDAIPKAESSQTAFLYLEMVKACVQDEKIAGAILESERAWTLFNCVDLPDFAVSASAFLVLKDLLLLFPSAVLKADRAKLLSHVVHLLGVGSGSQKKKSTDVIVQLLEGAPGLVASFAASEDLAKAVEALLLLRDKVATSAAPLFKVLASNEATTDEVRQVYGQPPATKEVLLEVLAEIKADESVIALLQAM